MVQEQPEVVKAAIQIIKTKEKLRDFKGEEMVSIANEFGKHLKDKGLTTSQIRKFLDAVITLKGSSSIGKDFDYRTETMMIKPKLAYAVGKDRNKGDRNAVKPLMEIMEPCIDRIYAKEDFVQFAKFVEAIVAYHKYHGGRD